MTGWDIPAFAPFPKIARWSREVIVTEKIDGTNGVIWVSDDGAELLAGSRTKWLMPGQPDNFGFDRWAQTNKAELLKLGPGFHFGEWWGSGIQRGYGLTNGERRFSLFNVARWSDPVVRPACCHVVPELWRGNIDDFVAEEWLGLLRAAGSRAAPFMNPEGIVIFHVASGVSFKKTLERDAEHKGAVKP